MCLFVQVSFIVSMYFLPDFSFSSLSSANVSLVAAGLVMSALFFINDTGINDTGAVSSTGIGTRQEFSTTSSICIINEFVNVIYRHRGEIRLNSKLLTLASLLLFDDPDFSIYHLLR